MTQRNRRARRGRSAQRHADDVSSAGGAPLSCEWYELPPREQHVAGEGLHATTMGAYARGGTVFSAGTTDTAQVLGHDARFDRNVIENLVHE